MGAPLAVPSSLSHTPQPTLQRPPPHLPCPFTSRRPPTFINTNTNTFSHPQITLQSPVRQVSLCSPRATWDCSLAEPSRGEPTRLDSSRPARFSNLLALVSPLTLSGPRRPRGVACGAAGWWTRSLPPLIPPRTAPCSTRSLLTQHPPLGCRSRPKPRALRGTTICAAPALQPPERSAVEAVEVRMRFVVCHER